MLARCIFVSASRGAPLSITCVATGILSRSPSTFPDTTSGTDLSRLTSDLLLLLGRPEFCYQFGMGIEQTQ